MDIAGKVALITGGARMGAPLVEALAAAGCHVAATYHHSQKSAEETLGRVRALGVKTLAIRADLAKPSAVDGVARRMRQFFRRWDILIHMASVYQSHSLTSLAKTPGPAFDRALAVDLRAAYGLSLAAAPHMKLIGSGRIVLFSDWVAASARPRYKNYIPYYVAKTGVKGLTESLALELAPHILVNAIAPGPILPPPGLTPRRNQEVLAQTPLGRWGGVKEIVKAALFLVQSDFVTGETLRVDGGRHLV